MWTIRKGRDIGEVDKSKVVESVCNISYMTAIKEEQKHKKRWTNDQSINNHDSILSILANSSCIVI